MTRVLITGATGFIGSHLLAECLSRGHEVRALVRPGHPTIGSLKRKGVEVVAGDIRQAEKMESAVDGVEIIFHCAAVVTDWAPRKTYREVTVGGTRHLCRAAARHGVERLVHLSTNDVFGYRKKRVIDETFPFKPSNEPYPDFKIKAEEICWLFHREQRLPLTVIYPCWVYGERDFTFTADLADAILKRNMLFWRKNAFFYPLYVGNLVDLMLTAAVEEKAVGNGYLAHDGEPVYLAEYCRHIADTFGVPPVSRHIPYPLAFLAAWSMESVWSLLRFRKRPLLTTYVVRNLGTRLRYSAEKAANELDWHPPIPFEDGLSRTMAWLKTVDPAKLKRK